MAGLKPLLTFTRDRLGVFFALGLALALGLGQGALAQAVAAQVLGQLRALAGAVDRVLFGVGALGFGAQLGGIGS